VIALYAFLTAFELRRERRRELATRFAWIAVPLLHGAVFLSPLVLSLLFPARVPPDGLFALFAFETVLYVVGTAFVVVVMAKERVALVHKTAAMTDLLTGLFNRRAFLEAANAMIERRARKAQPVSLLMFDLDKFKSINDRFGHAAGDEILKLFSAVVVNNLRISDLSGRIGGEEFAALLPCPLEEGVVVAERVREAFEASGIVCEEGPVDTTVSIGVAGGPAGTELEVLLAAADTALYQAKRSGRNRVEAAEELPLSLEHWRRKTAGSARPVTAVPRLA
jgi:diguanylate cyclase (GGDEF)-like protein